MKLVTRAEWGARPPANRTPLRATGCTAHWEGPHMGTFPHDQCAAKVREIQRFHMDTRGWSDIAYNAVACPHGYVFEGRGPGVRSAANGTDEGNDADYACCYLSGEGDPFTAAGQQAMADGMHWLSPGGHRNAHRDWKPTACPGDTIAAWAHSPAALSGSDQQEDDVTEADRDWFDQRLIDADERAKAREEAMKDEIIEAIASRVSKSRRIIRLIGRKVGLTDREMTAAADGKREEND